MEADVQDHDAHVRTLQRLTARPCAVRGAVDLSALARLAASCFAVTRLGGVMGLSFLNEVVADGQGVHPGAQKALDGFLRRADDGFVLIE